MTLRDFMPDPEKKFISFSIPHKREENFKDGQKALQVLCVQLYLSL